MKEYDWELVEKSPLFSGMNKEEVRQALQCLGSEQKIYEKDAYIFQHGETITQIGLILSGSAIIQKEDFWGNCDIISHVSKGELFGESFACMEMKEMPVSVVCKERTEVLFLTYQKIIRTCPRSCDFHQKLLQNMIRVMATKNFMLMGKMEHMMKRTTREKLLSYLSEQAMWKKSDTFQIPFDRQELADYLGVDRSAMSSELGKLKKDGILQFHKNKFILLKNLKMNMSL